MKVQTKDKKVLVYNNNKLSPSLKEVLSFPQMQDAAPEPILITDDKGLIYYVNPAWTKLTGYSFTEAVGKNPKFLQSGKTKKSVYKKLWKTLSEGKSFSTDEIRNKRQDGTEFQIHATYFPIKKNNNNIFYVQMMYDITERSAYIKSLFEKEEILDRIINNTSRYAIFMVSKKGFIKTWNSGAEKVTGYKSDEIIGKHIAIFYTQDDLKNNKPQKILNIAAVKGKYEEEGLRIKKDGSLYWAHVVITPILNKKGFVRGFVKITNDITENVQHRKDLEEKEKKYRFLMEQASDGIIIHNMNRNIVDANIRACEMFGYSHAELTCMHASELIKNEDTTVTEHAYKKVISGLPVIMEREVQRKDGTAFHIEFSSKRIEGGLVQSIIRDITARKKVENMLRFRGQILHHLAEGVCIIKLSDRKIILTNPAFDKMLGYKENELTGKEVSCINDNQKIWPKKMINSISKTIQKNHAWSGEIFNIKKDGTRVLSWVTLSSVTYPNIGECWIGVHQDITEKKELDRQKDAFIGIASHELKTPITTLSAYTQLLESRIKHKGDTKDAYLLQNILSQTNRITALVDDLLHVSRIQSGKLELTLKKIDLNELIRKTIIDFQYINASHEIIEKGSIQAKVLADENRIRQVLINFLTNAIKYSPKADKIIIHLTSEKNNALIGVQDFGLGITKEDIPHLFTRFYRSKEKSERNVSGFGLGLYISSEIIKKHRGKIWVESEEGKGSTFYFSLPLNAKN